jgi:hypothetical protein
MKEENINEQMCLFFIFAVSFASNSLLNMSKLSKRIMEWDTYIHTSVHSFSDPLSKSDQI